MDTPPVALQECRESLEFQGYQRFLVYREFLVYRGFPDFLVFLGF